MAKILFLGEGAVGKTSLATVLTNNDSKEYSCLTKDLTVGLDVHCLNFSTEKSSYSLSIWDFGGQPQFRCFQEDFMDKSLIAVLIFDVTRRSSYIQLLNWKKMILKRSKKAQFIIVGNKIDAPKRSVTFNAGQKLAIDLNCPYIETSAKTLVGIKKLRRKIKELVCNISDGVVNK